MIVVDQLSPDATNAVTPVTGPDAVALRWRLDNSNFRSQSEAGAPDRDYLFLERLTSIPINLTAGAHTLTLEYAGTDPTRSAAIDGFLWIPETLTKHFSGPSGSLTLTYDITRGQLSVEEK
jgi:hypothetical protein